MPDRKKKLRGERFRHKHQQLKWLSFVKSFHADRSVIKENNKLKHCKWAKGFQETEIATLVCWELSQLILFTWIIISKVISGSLKSGALPCSKLLIPQAFITGLLLWHFISIWSITSTLSSHQPNKKQITFIWVCQLKPEIWGGTMGPAP